ncbi:MAG: response regulator transcription factor [Lachnospiraceae bacterium]|nr:response regulator transcription factor [Lachnospiraceae bacterium]
MSDVALNIVLCDDQPQTIMELEKALEDFFAKSEYAYRITKFGTPSEVYDYMKSDTVHILFMDLEFGEQEEDGILWTEKIHEAYPETLVLIVTAYEKRYKEGYRVRAFRFMTKPLIRQELIENMEDCLRELGGIHAVQIKQKSRLLSIPTKEILYMEAYLGESKIYTEEETYFSEESLLWWEKKLFGGSFFRIHKSYLVNLSHVSEILAGRHQVVIGGGRKLPVARRKWTEFQKRFMRFDVSK